MEKIKKTYTRYGIYNHRDQGQSVYRRCKTGGYNNTGLQVGDVLADGRILQASKNIGNDWRNWTTVYAVAQR